VIPSAILGRYARSLADVVFEQNLGEKVTEDLKTYNEIFRAVPDLLEAFHSPAVAREAKEKLLGALLRRYPVDPVSSNFLRVLLEHNRLRYFPQIWEGFLKALNQRNGIVSVQVTAAAPLSEAELESLKQKLSGITGRRIDMQLRIDQNLLGGVVVQIGSMIFDGSIRTQLAAMKRHLSEN